MDSRFRGNDENWIASLPLAMTATNVAALADVD